MKSDQPVFILPKQHAENVYDTAVSSQAVNRGTDNLSDHGDSQRTPPANAP